MRTILTLLLSIAFLATKAQPHLFVPTTLNDSSRFSSKWQLRPYASMTAGYIFINGGISYLSPSVGLGLFHPLNKNVTAFAAVSAAPTIFSVNRLYTMPAMNPANGFSRPYNLGVNAGIQGGLMYTNDAGTFSISGSVGVERGSYPVYPVNRPNTKRQ